MPHPARASTVRLTEDSLTVDLADGRTISVPLAWYPRLFYANYANAEERSRWRLVGDGAGIHWPDVDDDISVANLLLGQPSGESQQSLKKWLARRQAKP